ncbi:voltage-dependent T-type calcium channel subunit alpha-1I isoform X2 [Chelonus insularis]|uniref:voltage-dependent T-type calcium channel subunit alpha-1I isoform X2 n=1 Tax=Chelonus insularis TaxID=460826 RepID=UPI00158AB4A9|nr:voltage-dependent T-type calcium channel subunit alpha-1I isoform X2 [Chelonus insularis]
MEMFSNLKIMQSHSEKKHRKLELSKEIDRPKHENETKKMEDKRIHLETIDNHEIPYPGFAPVALRYLYQSTRPRNWCLALITNPWFERVSMIVILLNCLTLGMYQPCVDDKCATHRCKILQILDDIIFLFFMIEMIIKMIAMGIYGQGTYLADAWNRLDFFIVVAGIVEYTLNVENINFSAIRTIRVLRPLRAINRIPSMRILVMLLLDTLPMLGNVLLLCFFVFFIFGIVGVQLWEGILRQRCFLKAIHNIKYPENLGKYFEYQGQDYICSRPGDNGMHSCYNLPPLKIGDTVCNSTAVPYSNVTFITNTSCVNWNYYYTECKGQGHNPFQGTISFDNIGLAWVAIFLVISLEGWTDIMYYVQDAHSFWDWIYFVLLIVIGSFFMINLCLVVIATQFSETKKREIERMKIERARFQSSSTLASSNNNSEPTSCYAEIVKYIAHLWRKGKRMVLKRIRMWTKKKNEVEKCFLSDERLDLFRSNVIDTQVHQEHDCYTYRRPSSLDSENNRFRPADNHVDPVLFMNDCYLSYAPRASPEMSDPEISLKDSQKGLLSINRLPYQFHDNVSNKCFSRSEPNNSLLRVPLSYSHHNDKIQFSSPTELKKISDDFDALISKDEYPLQEFDSCCEEKKTQTENQFTPHVIENDNGLKMRLRQYEPVTCQELLALGGAFNATLLTHGFDHYKFIEFLSENIKGQRLLINERKKKFLSDNKYSCCQSAIYAVIEEVNQDNSFCSKHIYEMRQQKRIIDCQVLETLQIKIRWLVEYEYFQQGILLAILINTFSMGIEYHQQPEELTVLVEMSNIVFSAIFALEMLLKIIAEGPFRYISNGFNVFDGIVVVLSVIELCQSITEERSGNSGLSVLRTFRLLRILKLVRFMPNLRRQLFVMLRTMDNVAVFFSLLVLFIFIFSILGMYLFGGKFCVWEDRRRPCTCEEIVTRHPMCLCDRKHFNDIVWALVTVFQILTQEDWNVVLFNGMQKTSHWAALYFVALMTFGNYVLFNLLVAILVEGFSSERDERKEREQRGATTYALQEANRNDNIDHSESSGYQSPFSSGNDENYLQDWKKYWEAIDNIGKYNERNLLANNYVTKKKVPPTPLIVETAATPRGSSNTTCVTSTQDLYTDDHRINFSDKMTDQLNRNCILHDFQNFMTLSNENQRRHLQKSQPSSAVSNSNRNYTANYTIFDTKIKNTCEQLEEVNNKYVLQQTSKNEKFYFDTNRSHNIFSDRRQVLFENMNDLKSFPNSELTSNPNMKSNYYPMNIFNYDSGNIFNDQEFLSKEKKPTLNQMTKIYNNSAANNSVRNENMIIEAQNITQKDNLRAEFDQVHLNDVSHDSNNMFQLNNWNKKKDRWFWSASLRNFAKSYPTYIDDINVLQKQGSKKPIFFSWFYRLLYQRREYSLYVFSPNNILRLFCSWLVHRTWFDNVILAFIGLNCITLAMERPTIASESYERFILTIANYIFTIVFTSEMIVKVIASGMFFGDGAYYTSGWNIMDGTLVTISIIDLLMTCISSSSPRIFGILRVFRLLRSLRPLRVINRAPGLKLVVQTLLSSLRPIGNIVLICCTFFIIFGILGVQLFKGTFYYCDGPDVKNVRNKTDCLQDPRNFWVNRKYNFDDLGNALMSLFVLSSRDGWVNIMYTGLDAVGVDQQPQENHSEWRLLYFISFILLVGFFVLNMFVGVVVENFHRCREEQEKEERVRRAAKRASQLEKRRRKMHEPPYYINYSKSRLTIHGIVTSKYFDLAIAAVIGLNVVTMAMEFYMMPKALSYALKIFNYFFTAVFIVESSMKLLALGLQLYLKDRWNQLDIGIVILSVVGIILEELESNIIPINPTIIRVMRVLRIARVLKLLKMAKGIRALLDTVMQALPQVGNLGLLFFLLFFIFAALGVELFGRLECNDEIPCQGLGEHAHFGNFGMAFLTLFRVATGDNWNGIMKDTLRDNCDNSSNCSKNCCVSSIVAPIFFVIFVLMAQFVLVNVVVAVLMKHLEESHKQIEDELNIDMQLERELVTEHELLEFSNRKFSEINSILKERECLGLQLLRNNARYYSSHVIKNHECIDDKWIPMFHENFYDNSLSYLQPNIFKVRSLPSNFTYNSRHDKRKFRSELCNFVLRSLRKTKNSSIHHYSKTSKDYLEKQHTRPSFLRDVLMPQTSRRKKREIWLKKALVNLCLSSVKGHGNKKCSREKTKTNDLLKGLCSLRDKNLTTAERNQSVSNNVLIGTQCLREKEFKIAKKIFVSNPSEDSFNKACDIIHRFKSTLNEKCLQKEVRTENPGTLAVVITPTPQKLKKHSRLFHTINQKELMEVRVRDRCNVVHTTEDKNNVIAINLMRQTDLGIGQSSSCNKHIYDEVNIYVDDEESSSIGDLNGCMIKNITIDRRSNTENSL